MKQNQRNSEQRTANVLFIGQGATLNPHLGQLVPGLDNMVRFDDLMIGSLRTSDRGDRRPSYISTTPCVTWAISAISLRY